MAQVATCTGFLSKKTQSIVRRSFHWLGRNIYVHPLWFMVLGILLIIVCLASSIIYVSQICSDDETKCMDNRSLQLWIPQQSTVWFQYTEIVDTFGTYPSVLMLLLTVNDDESILTPSKLDAAFEVIDTINNLTLYDHEDEDYEYDDLCTRSSPTQSHCDSDAETFFNVFFQNNESLWNDLNVTLQIINTPGAPTALYLGGLKYEENDPTMITSAQSLRLGYSLQGSTDEAVK